MSIDYQLDYDVTNTSCNEFLTKLNKATENKEFSITVGKIKFYISRFTNNIYLYLYSSKYLLLLELERDKRNLIELIICYCKKTISLYNTQEYDDIVLNDIHLFVIKTYILYKKYDLAMEYMQKNKIYDQLVLADCNYRLKKYKDTSSIISNIYISGVMDILSSTHLQMNFVKTK